MNGGWEDGECAFCQTRVNRAGKCCGEHCRSGGLLLTLTPYVLYSGSCTRTASPAQHYTPRTLPPPRSHHSRFLLHSFASLPTCCETHRKRAYAGRSCAAASSSCIPCIGMSHSDAAGEGAARNSSSGSSGGKGTAEALRQLLTAYRTPRASLPASSRDRFVSARLRKLHLSARPSERAALSLALAEHCYAREEHRLALAFYSASLSHALGCASLDPAHLVTLLRRIGECHHAVAEYAAAVSTYHAALSPASAAPAIHIAPRAPALAADRAHVPGQRVAVLSRRRPHPSERCAGARQRSHRMAATQRGGGAADRSAAGAQRHGCTLPPRRARTHRRVHQPGQHAGAAGAPGRAGAQRAAQRRRRRRRPLR